jgi:hypothetical protein
MQDKEKKRLGWTMKANEKRFKPLVGNPAQAPGQYNEKIAASSTKPKA